MSWLGLAGDAVLVTGGCGDIGRAVAWGLVEVGADVVLADRADQDPTGAAASLPGPGVALGVDVDVRDPDSVVRAVADGERRLGRPLTGLVAAAGVLRTGRIEETGDDAWNEILDVNATGSFRAVRAVLPSFRRAGRGSVVLVSSVSAFIAADGGTAYSTTKGAVTSFTYASAGELAPEGIRVNAVCPGWVDGGFTHQALRDAEDPEALRRRAVDLHLLGRMAAPGDVADAVVFLLSRRAAFITGTALLVDGGYMIKH